MKEVKKVKKVNNVKDLRDELTDMFEKLRIGEIGISEAKALSNVAGKIMSTAKTQLEYNKFLGNNKSSIDFLKSDK